MATLLHETQFFGPIATFSHYIGCDTICIEQWEHFQKRSYRNRIEILTPNGPLALSIPLCKGKNNQQLITDVKIAYEDPWIPKFLLAIRSAYGKAPYFEFYYDDIEAIMQRRYHYLFDLNQHVLLWLIKKIKLTCEITSTNTYKKDVTDAQDYRSFPWKKMAIGLSYTQIWSSKFDFIPNLSILDLLFCLGPETAAYLAKSKPESKIKVT